MCSVTKKYNKFNKILLKICIAVVVFGLTMAENSILNATTMAEFKEQHQSTAAAATAAVVSDDNLTIKHILTNLTMFNTEDFNENDGSMALIIENVTHTCLQSCIEEVSTEKPNLEFLFFKNIFIAFCLLKILLRFYFF